MERSSLISFCLTTLAFLTVLPLMPAQVGRAQDNGVGGGGLQIAKVSGTLKAMQQNKIKIAAEDKKEYFAVVNEQTALHYHGTAEADFVAQGLMVRFSAELNQNGQAQAPVAELEVFTYNPNPSISPEEAREQTPGVYQIGGEIGNLKKPAPKGNSKPSKQANAAAGDVQKYRVVGQVTQVQAGKVFVQAGAVRVQMELDPKVAITVASRDMTFCQMGDQVNVSGLRNGGPDQFIQCETLEITGAKPLGPAESKGAKNSKHGKGAKGKNAKAGADKNGSDKTGNGKDNANPSDDKKSDSKKPAPKRPTSLQ